MDLSPEQVARSQRTIRAAGVFAEHAPAIVAHVVELPEDHVVVAVVSEDYEFTGVHHVPRTDLVERVPALEGPGGWAMVFSPGADEDHVAARTKEMVSLADKRIEMIRRIVGRRGAQDNSGAQDSGAQDSGAQDSGSPQPNSPQDGTTPDDGTDGD